MNRTQKYIVLANVGVLAAGGILSSIPWTNTFLLMIIGFPVLMLSRIWMYTMFPLSIVAFVLAGESDKRIQANRQQKVISDYE